MSEAEQKGPCAPPELFFWVGTDCPYLTPAQAKKSLVGQAKYRLLHFAGLCGEEMFCELFIGWNETGLFFQAEVESKRVESSYPDLANGNAIELFIDTRNIKRARTTHRFCHHFFFLPEAIDGISCGEITRFRTEDAHPLAESSKLVNEVSRTPHGYSARMRIPEECLVGYTPEKDAVIGFTYRVHRRVGAPQHFWHGASVSEIERYPYLWAILELKKSKK